MKLKLIRPTGLGALRGSLFFWEGCLCGVYREPHVEDCRHSLHPRITPTRMADNKLLVKNTAWAVKATLVPAFEALELAIETLTREIGSEFANISTLLTTLEARVEAIEKSLVPDRRRKTGGSDTDDPLDKITNSMLYTRRLWADNEEFRAKYLSEGVRAKLDEDCRVSKHPTDTEARWLAEGHIFWHRCATPQQKTEIRDAFNRWKEERSCAQLPEPLVDDE